MIGARWFGLPLAGFLVPLFVFVAGVAVADAGSVDSRSGTAQGKKAVWTLSTGDTRVTVGVDSTDQLVIYKLTSPGGKWNWTSTPSVMPLPTQAAINGANPVPVTWRFEDASRKKKRGSGNTVTLTFACVQSPKLTLKSVWWASPPKLPGPVQHTFVIDNDTGSPISLAKPFLDIAVQPESGRKASLCTFCDQQGARQKLALTDGFQTAMKSNNGAQGQPMPFVLIDDGGAGGLYIGMEEQKDFSISVKALETASVRASAGYLSDERLSIAAGSTVTTPPTYVGTYQGDIEDGCNKFKRWFWNNKTPANHRNDPTAPWATFGGMWTYETKGSKAANAVWWSDEATYRKGVEKEGLAGIGFEAVEVDANWDEAEKVGDWPSGTKIMGPLAHANGLKFTFYLMAKVVWDSREYLKTIWHDYSPDMWRNDFQTTDLDVQAWAQENLPKNYKFDMSPSSSDFKSLTYASLVDIYADNPAEVRKSFYNLSYVLPPAQICIIYHLPYAVGDKDHFNAYYRSTMLCGSWIGVAAIGQPYNPKNIVLPSDIPELIPCMKANLALYKSKLRPLIREGNLYHDIVDPASGFDGAEYLSQSKNRGTVLLFGPSGGKTTVHFKKLNPRKSYRVEFTDQPSQNTTRTGAQLMTDGLPVTFTGNIQSEIILIRI